MALATALALASILAIVGYLNRITRRQYVGRIMERIQREALALVEDLPYGSRMGRRHGDTVPEPDVTGLGPAMVVESHTDGWVQQISRAALLAAVPAGTVVRIETRIGAYLVRGEPLVRIWPTPGPERAAEIARLIGEAAIIGVTRTMQQDIDFALRQLNDIGLRALSPAVNDPTTAIEVILRVTSIMRPLILAELPTRAQRDTDGRVLFAPWDLDHAGYVRHAYGQVRLYAAGHPHVVLALIRSMRMLRAVAVEAGRDGTVTALDTEIDATLTGAEAAGLTESDLRPARAIPGAPG
jgi:uncharacterized membrane protein